MIQHDKDLPPYLTPAHVGKLTQQTLGTLANQRASRRGPPFVRLSGRAVRYPRDDFFAWMSERMVDTRAVTTK